MPGKKIGSLPSLLHILPAMNSDQHMVIKLNVLLFPPHVVTLNMLPSPRPHMIKSGRRVV